MSGNSTLQRDGLTVTIVETHAHDDDVTGGLELARTAGVPHLDPCEAAGAGLPAVTPT